MKSTGHSYKFAIAIFVILGSIAYLSISAEQSNKSYYVTIKQLQTMGNKAYTRHLRVSGRLEPGTLVRKGTNADFVFYENHRKLRVEYVSDAPPPDTFKPNMPALAVGTYSRDGIFHATQLQAKCASHYGPQKPNAKPAMQPAAKNASTTPAGTAMADAQPALHK